MNYRPNLMSVSCEIRISINCGRIYERSHIQKSFFLEMKFSQNV